MLIILAFIISIDSFFISCLTSGKLKLNFILIMFSPLLHVLFCFWGILLQNRIIPSCKSHSILLYILIIILISSGLYLFVIYKPKKEIRFGQNHNLPITSSVIVLLLLFCSFDAVISGIVFVYWNIPMFKSLIFIYIINLLMVLFPITFKQLQKRVQ